MAYLRRKALYSGLLGGQRRWLIWGGAAWAIHFVRRLFGTGEPVSVYTRDLDPGERFVVLHNEKVNKKRKSKRA
jgi:hypothetical protein